jgi:hypothetical protein
MDNLFLEKIGKQFLATVISVDSSLCVKPYPVWHDDNLCGILSDEQFAIGDVVLVSYENDRWQILRKETIGKDVAAVRRSIKFEPAEPAYKPKRYHPAGVSTADTTYKGGCGGCGR